MWLTKVKSLANDIQSALTAEDEEVTDQEVTSEDSTKQLAELTELTTTQDKEVKFSKGYSFCSQINYQMFFLVFR
jgi:hypothetical protein